MGSVTTIRTGRFSVGTDAKDTRRVQLQFTDLGYAASAVQDWLEGRFSHCRPYVAASPGLAVSLSLPAGSDATSGSWHGRLMEPCAGLDLALEIVERCFEQLGLEPCGVLAVHWTYTA
jgi:hypothetical protein